jgi:hypothetical protein
MEVLLEERADNSLLQMSGTMDEYTYGETTMGTTFLFLCSVRKFGEQ